MERFSAGQQRSVVLGFTQPDQDEPHVGQRRQIPRCAQRALRGDVGVDAAIEHLQKEVYGLRPNPRVPFRQSVGSDQQNGPHTGTIQPRTGAHRMADEDVALQLRHSVEGNLPVSHLPESGGDPIGDPALRDDLLDRLGTAFHPLPCLA